VDVDQWHARLERKGLGEAGIRNRHLVLRAAMTLAVRWGWVPTNVVAAARLGRRSLNPGGPLATTKCVRCSRARHPLVAAGRIEPQASIALRLAAMTGARRSELAALRWEELHAGRLVIDSSIAILRSGDGSRRPTLRDDRRKRRTDEWSHLTPSQSIFWIHSKLNLVLERRGYFLLGPNRSIPSASRPGGAELATKLAST